MRRVEAQSPNPAIDEHKRRTAEAILLTTGGDFGIRIQIGQPGSGWYFDFQQRYYNVDGGDLATKPLNVIIGLATHEGAHAATSRMQAYMDHWHKPGFSFGVNAQEDPRVNQNAMVLKPGSRENIQAYIEEDLEPGGGLEYKQIQQDTERRLGYVPKFMQWGTEQIRFWYEKEFTDRMQIPEDLERFLGEIPDDQVRETCRKTLPFFEEFYHTIPASRDEMIVQQKADESARNFIENVWPEYQKLVDQSLDEQSLVKMLEDMLAQDDASGQGGQMVLIPFSSLPQDVQDEIKQKMQDAQGKRQQEQQPESDQQSADASGGQQDATDQSQARNQAGSDDGQSNAEEQDAQSEETGQESSATEEQEPKIPWDQLSDTAKEAVGDAFDQLPPEQKEKYQEEAQKDLEDVEDAANEKLRGKAGDPRHQETHKERREREQRESERAQEQRQEQQIIENMEREREEVLRAQETSPYQAVLDDPEVARLIREQDRNFARIFRPDDDPNIRYGTSGLRVSMKRAVEAEADPRRGNIFERKGTPTEKSHRILTLVDMSKSMAGTKIEETFKTLVINTEPATKHGIETGIFGYTDTFPGNIREYKGFDTTRLTPAVRDEIGKILTEGRGSTPTLQATDAAYDILVERQRRHPKKHNFFITITDGQPNGGPAAVAAKIEQIRRNKSIVTCGFGIGPGTEFVNDIYPQLHDRIKRDIARALGKDLSQISNSFADAVEFTTASAIIMGYMVAQPELFH